MERGKVIIIPNENKILADYYEKNISMNHLEAYQEFSDKYKLGYHFRVEDYQNAPIVIAKEGHMSFKTTEESNLLIIYLPQTITSRQIEWFYKNKEKYSSQTIGAFSIEKDSIKTLKNMLEIEKVINKKYMLYERKEEEENVRKEI